MLIRNIIKTKGSNVFNISSERTVYEAIKKMAKKNIGALLVMENGQLLGIITERDYRDKVILKGRTSKTTKVKVIMSTNIDTVGPSDTVEKCMEMMTQGKFRHLPVIEDEKVAGIVSIGDLVNAVISKQEGEINTLRKYIGGGSYPR
jgi:CBS domain-containing protein